MALINIKNISHSYDDKNVLSGLSLQIQAQKITCLLGSSGSGKTTLLRLIAGLETPNKGIVEIDNQIVTNNNKILIPPSLRQIGFVFQDLALWPHFTVYKNISFGLQQQKDKECKKKVTEILDFFQLTDYAQKYPHQLSGGQKQLVAIARSLVLHPKILLMDEPLANLDNKLKKQILAHITNLHKHFNLTIVYVTHDHKEAFSIANEVIVLNKGQIELKGTVAEIKNSKNEYLQYFLDY